MELERFFTIVKNDQQEIIALERRDEQTIRDSIVKYEEHETMDLVKLIEIRAGMDVGNIYTHLEAYNSVLYYYGTMEVFEKWSFEQIEEVASFLPPLPADLNSKPIESERVHQVFVNEFRRYFATSKKNVGFHVFKYPCQMFYGLFPTSPPDLRAITIEHYKQEDSPIKKQRTN